MPKPTKGCSAREEEEDVEEHACLLLIKLCKICYITLETAKKNLKY
jgi:hypothetical protein